MDNNDHLIKTAIHWNIQTFIDMHAAEYVRRKNVDKNVIPQMVTPNGGIIHLLYQSYLKKQAAKLKQTRTFKMETNLKLQSLARFNLMLPFAKRIIQHLRRQGYKVTDIKEALEEVNVE